MVNRTTVLCFLILLGCSLAISPLLGSQTAAAQDPIEQVDPESLLPCNGLITFDDVAGGSAPGTNYDAVFESGNTDIAERFAGQTLTEVGDFDQLSGSPTSPLTLQIGNPNQNVNIYNYELTGEPILTGLGHLGYPLFNAIGEGSFAVLFDFDQSKIGFILVGDNGGTATVNFFQRDGTLIGDPIVLSDLGVGAFGFARAGGLYDIAGFSIHNDDPAGIGIYLVCHDVPGIPGHVVEIDIKPGSDPNSISTKSKGLIAVAILGSESFDVTDVDVTTLRFGPDEALPAHDLTDPDIYDDHLVMPWLHPGPDGEYGTADDVYYTANEDNIPDLVVHFYQQETGISVGDTEVCLTGATLGGIPISGCDVVLVKK